MKTSGISSKTSHRFAAALLLTTSLTVVLLTTPAMASSDMDAYAASGYNYCDAKLIGDLWGIGVDEAKAQIGMKIRNGLARNIPRVLALSRRSGNSCEWEDTGYSYEDAVQLAQLWGLSEPYQAKQKVARYLTNGQADIVEGALGH